MTSELILTKIGLLKMADSHDILHENEVSEFAHSIKESLGISYHQYLVNFRLMLESAALTG